MTEATAVEARGRISPGDLGVWKDAHVEELRKAATFIEEHGAVAGMQLAHAGRKASHAEPWNGGKPLLSAQDGGWAVVGPSAIPFQAGSGLVPQALEKSEIADIVKAFAEGAKRALDAGFRLVEIHAAHGYLLHQFLSPLSNHREDEYGGSFGSRVRFVLEVIAAVRKVWPDHLPLAMRVSSTDWVEGGWTLEDTVSLARFAKEAGVDLIDCSSGGNVPDAKIPAGPRYQVPFAEGVRQGAGVASAAVGMITEPEDAEDIVASGKADFVFLARAMLRDPYWPLHAAKKLEKKVDYTPRQYGRAL